MDIAKLYVFMLVYECIFFIPLHDCILCYDVFECMCALDIENLYTKQLNLKRIPKIIFFFAFESKCEKVEKSLSFICKAHIPDIPRSVLIIISATSCVVHIFGRFNGTLGVSACAVLFQTGNVWYGWQSNIGK